MDLYGATYEAMLENDGVQWPCPTPGESGSLRRYELATDRHLQRLVQEGRVTPPPDGIYFYGRPDGRARIFKRPQRPPAEPPDAVYPLYLTTGRVVHHWHTGTMTMRVPWLKKAVPNAFVEINADDAERRGIAEGDAVRVSTRRGDLTLPARVPKLSRLEPLGLQGRISIPRPGVVFIPFFDPQLLVNLLTIDAVDDMSKEPEYKICACEIAKVV